MDLLLVCFLTASIIALGTVLLNYYRDCKLKNLINNIVHHRLSGLSEVTNKEALNLVACGIDVKSIVNYMQCHNKIVKWDNVYTLKYLNTSSINHSILNGFITKLVNLKYVELLSKEK